MRDLKQTLHLRVSNTGNAVQTLVQHHKYSVNLPASLRSLGPTRIIVMGALINYPPLAVEGNNISEVFLTCNIPIPGIGTETAT